MRLRAEPHSQAIAGDGACEASSRDYTLASTARGSERYVGRYALPAKAISARYWSPTSSADRRAIPYQCAASGNAPLDEKNFSEHRREHRATHHEIPLGRQGLILAAPLDKLSPVRYHLLRSAARLYSGLPAPSLLTCACEGPSQRPKVSWFRALPNRRSQRGWYRYALSTWSISSL